MDSLAKLFGSPARLKLLRLFLFNDDTAFSISEATSRVRLSKDAVGREIQALAALGILKKHKKGRAGATYVANPSYQHHDAFQAFLRTTTSLRDTDIITGLRKAGTLRLIVLSGLFTGALESKVDMLVVGDRLVERSLAQVVRGLEAELGRELRYAFFSTEEYRYRLGVYDRLIRDVMDYPNRPILDRMAS